MTVQTQPDDRSTALTRALGNMTGWFGSFPAILGSFVIVLVWFLGGLFVHDHFSNDTYQLVINTFTTIVTFWMVFIIQNTQNRDGRAIQAKLDAQSQVLHHLAERLDVAGEQSLLIRTVGLEDAPEEVIKQDQDRVRKAAMAVDQPGLAHAD